jgi:hypothetical protein
MVFTVKTSNSSIQPSRNCKIVNWLSIKCTPLTLLCGVGLTHVYCQRLNAITAPLREPQGPEDTAEKLKAEREAAQDFIGNGKQLKFLMALYHKLMVFCIKLNPSRRKNKCRRPPIWRTVSLIGVDATSSS